MSDLNTMLREHALTGLQTQLDAAVTNGDTVAARKVSDEIAKLQMQTAPKAPPYGDAEIRAALGSKADWFGVDPKKSGRVIELGKHMDPKKFSTAEAFADALIKAVDAEFPVTPAAGKKDGEEEGDEPDDEENEDGEPATSPKKKRATDAPGEGDTLGRAPRTRSSGPWTKLSDAPADIQKEVTRSADKFVPKSGDPKVTKERRDSFIARALESHYATHLRNKGKK
jgi:hypothetical protein